MLRILTLVVLFWITPKLVHGESARLIAVASDTNVNPHQSVKLDVYLYNPNSHPVMAPSLEFISARLWTSDASRKRNGGAAEVQGQTSTHPPPPQSLTAKSIQYRTTNVRIDAREGDLIEISLEVGDKKKLRSNSVLMFCAPKEKQR